MRSGRHPFEVTVLVAALVCGVALVIADVRPRSVADAMPITVQLIWRWSLVVVGAVGLVGITWRGHRITGLGIELGAMFALGTTTCMYAIALLAISGISAVAGASFVTAVATGAWWRAGQITRDLHALARYNETVAVHRPLLAEKGEP